MPQHGIQSVTVPGAVDGWQKLLERFGKKKLPELLAPAIWYCGTGLSCHGMDCRHLEATMPTHCARAMRPCRLTSPTIARRSPGKYFVTRIWLDRCA